MNNEYAKESDDPKRCFQSFLLFKHYNNTNSMVLPFLIEKYPESQRHRSFPASLIDFVYFLSSHL